MVRRVAVPPATGTDQRSPRYEKQSVLPSGESAGKFMPRMGFSSGIGSRSPCAHAWRAGAPTHKESIAATAAARNSLMGSPQKSIGEDNDLVGIDESLYDSDDSEITGRRLGCSGIRVFRRSGDPSQRGCLNTRIPEC